MDGMCGWNVMDGMYVVCVFVCVCVCVFVCVCVCVCGMFMEFMYERFLECMYGTLCTECMYEMCGVYGRLQFGLAIRARVVNSNTLQHTAAHCSTLQHTATHCNTPMNCFKSGL